MKAELDLAERAARTAGSWLRSRHLEALEVLSSKGRDIKLAADVKAERLILELLRAESPHPVLAEESGSSGLQTTDGYTWIVDPLDGTFNFERDIPFCAVSIALVRGQEPVLGAVYAMNQDELFSGIVGEGAWCNGKPISVSAQTDPSLAVLATGFPVNFDFSSQGMTEFARQMQRFKKVRLLGSAALSLAYVASGRLDAYSEANIMFWDVAAGLALVRAAGGVARALPTSGGEWARVVTCAASDRLLG